VQSLVLRAVEVPINALESYHMLVARVVIVSAEHSNAIRDIRTMSGDHVHEASDDRLVYGRIAGFFIGLPLVKLHPHWCSNQSGLVHSELRQYRPNVAVLIDVDCVMLQIAFDVHAEIEGDTPEINHSEPLLHLILDLPNQAVVSNDKEIIDVLKDCGNDYALILIMQHEQSSIDT
jgi:hypothetical protein